MRRYGTKREFERLAGELEQRADVENPYALASWILRRKYGGSNPGGHAWEPDGDGWRCDMHGASLRLQPGAEVLEVDRGWLGWTLTADDDPVCVFVLPDEGAGGDDARVVAEVWIDAWAHDWSQ